VTVELNRRFVRCGDDERSDPDLIAHSGRTAGTLGWDDLLAKRRVVFLAEAGSGKTTEMEARARALAAEGRAAFYATVEDVGRRGMEAALRHPDRAQLTAWRASEQDAWFFIDSVDEARNTGVKLRAALQAIAEAIAGAERRAHVVLSARYTDWRFRQDLALLKEELSIPSDQPLPLPPSPDELVISTIHREAPREKDPPEEPIVVVMTGLDEMRARQFAAGQNLKNPDSLMGQIEGANLWQFARRPLDLGWLVEFWHRSGRLGNLAEMLETCLSERLQESNTDRARQDGLDLARAAQAVERIGAALSFGRQETIEVPDSDMDFAPETSSLDIADVLPDWSQRDRVALLGRAVFDPATLGRARFHNDNQGVVRGYLTARWLHRLRKCNLSQTGLSELLFAQTYGIDVIKPSMQETAAWLSLWDKNIAREVARRNPFLLFTAGDPATLSRQARESLLRQVITRIAAGERVPTLDFDSLKRFSRPDLADMVRKLWDKHSANDEVRRFLLRTIWLGEIKAVADIAAKVALTPVLDRTTSIVAGRALMAAGDEAVKRQYATLVKTNCVTLPATVVWDALAKLFPEYLGVGDLLDILSQVDVTASDGGLGLDRHFPKMLARMNLPRELEATVTGLLSQLGVAADDRVLTKREEAYLGLIGATTHRLLELSPIDQAPQPAIAAIARLGESARWLRSRRRTRTTVDLIEELQRSTQRRRLAFWGVAKRLTGHRLLDGRPIDSLSDLQILGWSVALSVNDIDWLLADGPLREADHERKLAIDTAMVIWRNAGSPDVLRERIANVAKADPAMKEALGGWISPRRPSPEFTRQENEIKRLERRNALERAKQDKSWVDFAARLRTNPAEMRNLRPTTAESTDSRLYDLWRLLSQTADADRRYAMDSVAPLEPMIGREAAEGFRLGLIVHWRARTPWVRSAREGVELNQVRDFDCMGLVGISLEARVEPGWAATLSSEDARRAVEYATLELNGFPTWLTELARARPDDVRAILSREVRAELNRPSDALQGFVVLQDIARGDKVIAELMAPVVLAGIEARTDLDAKILSTARDIVLRGGTVERDHLKTLALERFERASDPAESSLYIGAAFAINGAAATAAVFAKLDKLDPADQPALVQCVLPHIFGRQFSDDHPVIENLPLESLERLVRLAFQTIHPRNDNDHSSGEVYSPDPRDDAEHARNVVFERLANTPNRAGFDAILRLAGVPDFPVPKARLHAIAKERAEKDSESAAWKPGEAAAFEASAETEPQTPRDLQLVALHRLADMQYDLQHDDFQQGETLAGLKKERAVQKWTGDRLRLKQGRSYSAERETHVADENEPDIRLRAKVTDASVPIEIKVAESWTLEELESALTEQLCEKYLRAREGRHGILLLVHQASRPRGWLDVTGKTLTFEQVVSRLRTVAVAISGSSPDAPQPEIAVLDVSSFTAAKKAKPEKAKKGTKTAKKRKTEEKAVKTPEKGKTAKKAAKTASKAKPEKKPAKRKKRGKASAFRLRTSAGS
jgi:hypothetical protein